MEQTQTEQIMHVTKDMTMGEIISKYPSAAEIMMSYGLHCVGCHVSYWETLEQGLLGHGGNNEQVENLVTDINEAISKQKFEDKGNLIISEKASNKLRETLKNYKDKTGLRIHVSSGGCAGFSYNFTLVDNKEEDDIVIENSGFNIYIDNKSINLIKGSTIDYIEALSGAGFKVSNPNATSTCSCGNSFS